MGFVKGTGKCVGCGEEFPPGSGYQSRLYCDKMACRPILWDNTKGEYIIRVGPKKRVVAARWMVQEAIGRPLHQTEAISYRDGDRRNLSLQNLVLWSLSTKEVLWAGDGKPETFNVKTGRSFKGPEPVESFLKPEPVRFYSPEELGL